ncbi:hypothetical protein CKA32_003025 [Geitlerinema sp. FC II]|nr:hypothetical protein CKA32_003025 [Geitlerinema sp. FC II]
MRTIGLENGVRSRVRKQRRLSVVVRTECDRRYFKLNPLKLRDLVSRSVSVVVIGIVKSVPRSEKQAQNHENRGYRQQCSFNVHNNSFEYGMSASLILCEMGVRSR